MKGRVVFAAALAIAIGAGAHAQPRPPEPPTRVLLGEDMAPPPDLSMFRGRPGPPMRGRMHRARMMMEQLNLTETQRNRLEEIRDRHRRKAIATRADLGIVRLDLRGQMRSGKPEQARIDALIDRIAALRADLQKVRVASMLEARTVLTVEQQKKLRELRRERHRPLPTRRMQGRTG